MAYRMAQISVTSSDLGGHFCCFETILIHIILKI